MIAVSVERLEGLIWVPRRARASRPATDYMLGRQAAAQAM